MRWQASMPAAGLKSADYVKYFDGIADPQVHCVAGINERLAQARGLAHV